MLSRCLNPNCGTPFSYLHEGRIFQIERVRVAPGSQELQRSVESYWLCRSCSSRLKVIVENGCVVTCPMDAMPSLRQNARETAMML